MKVLRISLTLFGALLLFRAVDLHSEPIDWCGWLSDSYPPGCVIFQSAAGWDEYVTDLPVLPDSLRLVAVRIRGDLTACQPLCPGYHQCITGAVLGECEPSDLGCGVLDVDDDFCTTWTSPVYGTLLTFGLDGRAAGDTVRAIGIIDYRGTGVCGAGGNVLFNATFADCPDTTSAVEYMRWGTLKNIFR